MIIENFVRLATTVISIASIFYIPKSKYRLALISFLSAQTVTWASSIAFVQIGWIEYPVREFSKATRAGFLHHFLFTPAIFTWFVLSFPKNSSLLKKLVHYIIFVSLAAWFAYFICVYTSLMKFSNGSFTIQFIFLYSRLFIYFLISHIYITWFSKKTNISI